MDGVAGDPLVGVCERDDLAGGAVVFVDVCGCGIAESAAGGGVLDEVLDGLLPLVLGRVGDEAARCAVDERFGERVGRGDERDGAGHGVEEDGARLAACVGVEHDVCPHGELAAELGVVHEREASEDAGLAGVGPDAEFACGLGVGEEVDAVVGGEDTDGGPEGGLPCASVAAGPDEDDADGVGALVFVGLGSVDPPGDAADDGLGEVRGDAGLGDLGGRDDERGAGRVCVAGVRAAGAVDGDASVRLEVRAPELECG